MTISRIDPRTDQRWQTFLENRPGAGIFHTAAWLEALRRTYRHEPHRLTYSRYPSRMGISTDGLLMATGRRFVAAIPASLFAKLGGLLYRHAG